MACDGGLDSIFPLHMHEIQRCYRRYGVSCVHRECALLLAWHYVDRKEDRHTVGIIATAEWDDLQSRIIARLQNPNLYTFLLSAVLLAGALLPWLCPEDDL